MNPDDTKGQKVKAESIRSWSVLVALTVALTITLRMVNLPGALMLGPMMSGIVIALTRPGLSVPRSFALTAQALLGCLIATVMSPDMVEMTVPRLPLLFAMNGMLIVGIAGLGLLAARTGFIPGTSAIWGMSPGAASAMVVLSESYGGDKRLVALLQYLRLVALAFFVILFGSVFGEPHVGDPELALPGTQATPWLSPVEPFSLSIIIGLTVISILAAIRFRIAALVIFIPLFIGVAIQATGAVKLTVPPIASAIAFAVIGWSVGLGFTREALSESARMIPRIAFIIVMMLLFCLALSWVFTLIVPIDFVTAYLALNPGGADVVLITAASLEVDIPLIMTMQVTRIIMVFIISPGLGRLAAGYYEKRIRQGADGN
jgi:hypothetical protein